MYKWSLIQTGRVAQPPRAAANVSIHGDEYLTLLAHMAQQSSARLCRSSCARMCMPTVIIFFFPSSGFLLQAELRRWEEGARWVAGLQTKTKTKSIFNVCSWSWSHCCIAIVRQRKCRLMIVKVLWSRSHYYVKKDNACDCSSIG